MHGKPVVRREILNGAPAFIIWVRICNIYKNSPFALLSYPNFDLVFKSSHGVMKTSSPEKHLRFVKSASPCTSLGCFFVACQRFSAVRTSTQPKITHIEVIKFHYFHANVFILRELALQNVLFRLVSYKSAPTPKLYFYLTARQSLMSLIYWLMLRQTRMYWQMVLAFCWPRP